MLIVDVAGMLSGVYQSHLTSVHEKGDICIGDDC